MTIPRNFEEGAEILRWLFDAEFPKLAPQDWIAFAQRSHALARRKKNRVYPIKIHSFFLQ